jgi:hypothetical protein
MECRAALVYAYLTLPELEPGDVGLGQLLIILGVLVLLLVAYSLLWLVKTLPGGC